jgi:hypothetical protein
MLPWLKNKPEMQCTAMNRKTSLQCKNPKNFQNNTCRYHGARKIRRGELAPNYKTGAYTQKEQKRHREVMGRIKTLTKLAKQLGMIK